MVLGWDEDGGWRIMPGLPAFATKEEALERDDFRFGYSLSS